MAQAVMIMQARLKKKQLFDDNLVSHTLLSEKRRALILGAVTLVLLLFYLTANSLGDIKFRGMMLSKLPMGTVTVFLLSASLVQILFYYLWKAMYTRRIRPRLYLRYLSTFIEVGLPSIAAIAISSFVDPVVVLHSPLLLIYFLLIALSALRLDFHLSVFTGIMCALQYTGVALLMLGNTPVTSNEIFYSTTHIVSYGVFYIIGGLVTGTVTSIIENLTRRFITIEQKFSTFEQELAVARSVQQSNLPVRLPVMPHVRIASSYIPMVNVGGDFYDFFLPNDNELGLLIADVTGHGIGAALVASMVKIAFAQQKQVMNDPLAVVSNINTLLMEKGDSQVATAAYTYVNIAEQLVVSCNAGHWPVLVITPDGRVRELNARGTMIGFMHDLPLEVVRSNIEGGETVFMYTDGLLEQTNIHGEEYGYGRLKETLVRNAGQPADELVRQVETDLEHWRGTVPCEDDITMVAVELTT